MHAVYKIVANKNGVLFSAVLHDLPLQYPVERKMRPAVGRILAFSGRGAADDWRQRQGISWRDGKIEIWEAESDDQLELGYILQLKYVRNGKAFTDFWTFPDEDMRLLKLPVAPAPAGTVSCGSISLKSFLG